MRFMLIKLLLVCFTMFGCVSCRDLSYERSQTLYTPPELHPSTHLPGTLLRDSRGVYWMVMNWPERSIVPQDQILQAHLRLDSAVAMSAQEEVCLRDSGGGWFFRECTWQLYRLRWGGFVYIEPTYRLRRYAHERVVESRGGNGATAPFVEEPDQSTFEAHYHDDGMMLFPDGTLVRTEEGLFYYTQGVFRRFVSDDVAREAGYNLETAIDFPELLRSSYGTTGEELRTDLFMMCPLAAANARRDEDADGDGSPRHEDCDDTNEQRAPHLQERCDGIDNNCNGLVDEGYQVGEPCVIDDSCHTPGFMQCAYDRWHASCVNDDAICEL